MHPAHTLKINKIIFSPQSYLYCMFIWLRKVWGYFALCNFWCLSNYVLILRAVERRFATVQCKSIYCDIMPESQSRHSLLDNDTINTFPRQRINKQQSRYCWATKMETVFSVVVAPRLYNRVSWDNKWDSLMEAGSNTSTVALGVVGGNVERSLEFETVKYCCESQGTRTGDWMRWRGPAAIVNDRLILSSERMLHKDYDQRCSIEKKNSLRESQGARRQDEMIGGKPPVVK
jgi:hypothetical protein